MSTIERLLKEILNLETEHAKTDHQQSELSAQRREKLNELRQAIIAGASTGDPLFDAIIVNHHLADPRQLERLRAIESEVATHPDELIMVVERDLHQFVHRDPGPSSDEDFMTTESATIGRLNGSTLVVNIPAPGTAAPSARTAARLNGPDYRNIGFPTSGYVIGPQPGPKPVVIAGNLFPEYDLLMTYRQPLRSPFDDIWSGRSHPGGAIPMFPRPRPSGNKLDIYIGNEAVEEHLGSQLLTRPLHLWWIRQALGYEQPTTPEIDQALAWWRAEHLKKLEEQLGELLQRKQQAKLDELEQKIRANVLELQRLEIELTTELKAELARHLIVLPA